MFTCDASAACDDTRGVRGDVRSHPRADGQGRRRPGRARRSALLVAALARGHVLIEGAPGPRQDARRAIARARVGRALQAHPVHARPHAERRHRLERLRPRRRARSRSSPGRSSAQLLLADEINRAPAKTQSALLEAMQDRQVTVDGTSRPLPAPFVVIATQNPVESQGTYPLPEAQLDRFLVKLTVADPPRDVEQRIVQEPRDGLRPDRSLARSRPVTSPEELARDAARSRSASASTTRSSPTSSSSCARTREDRAIELGASPRASIALMKAAQVVAASEGRDFVTPDDVKPMAKPVLRHRVMLHPDAELQGITADERIDDILRAAPVPRAPSRRPPPHPPAPGERVIVVPTRRFVVLAFVATAIATRRGLRARASIAAWIALDGAHRRSWPRVDALAGARTARRGRAQGRADLLGRSREPRHAPPPQHERARAPRHGDGRSDRRRDHRPACPVTSRSRRTASVTLRYEITPTRRGKRSLGAVTVRYALPLGLLAAAGAHRAARRTSTSTPTSTPRARSRCCAARAARTRASGSLRVRGGDTEFERLRPYQRRRRDPARRLARVGAPRRSRRAAVPGRVEPERRLRDRHRPRHARRERRASPASITRSTPRSSRPTSRCAAATRPGSSRSTTSRGASCGPPAAAPADASSRAPSTRSTPVSPPPTTAPRWSS